MLIEELIRKIKPTDMYYHAKLRMKLKMNEYQEWIR